jgi:hypothetical protein
LPERQPKHRFQDHAGLDRRIGKHGFTAALAGTRGQLLHLKIEPDQQ